MTSNRGQTTGDRVNWLWITALLSAATDTPDVEQAEIPVAIPFFRNALKVEAQLHHQGEPTENLQVLTATFTEGVAPPRASRGQENELWIDMVGEDKLQVTQVPLAGGPPAFEAIAVKEARRNRWKDDTPLCVQSDQAYVDGERVHVVHDVGEERAGPSDLARHEAVASIVLGQDVALVHLAPGESVTVVEVTTERPVRGARRRVTYRKRGHSLELRQHEDHRNVCVERHQEEQDPSE